MQVHVSDALRVLHKSGKEFKELYTHGSLVLEIYKPGETDKQQPHTRDEVYIIISGKGSFLNDGTIADFQAGDFLFVAAGKEHRFIKYTEDFVTWVLFYGPEGGEKNFT